VSGLIDFVDKQPQALVRKGQAAIKKDAKLAVLPGLSGLTLILCGIKNR
jgi:hypothetical protein